MASILKTDEIQSQNGSSAIDVANGTLKHPSSASNNLVLGSDGSATINQISSSSSFPYDGTTDAGRVIQVKHLTSRESNGLDTSWTVRWNYSLTLKSGNSRIMVLHTENTFCSSSSGYGVKVYRNNSAYSDASTTFTGTAVYDDIPLNASNNSHMVYIYNGEMYTINPINFVDDVSSFDAGDTVYYGHYYQEYSGTAVVPAGGNGSNHGAFITIIMELEK